MGDGLAPEQREEAGRYALHPALLDAALHGIALAREGSEEIELPWVWSGVSASVGRAGELRVRLAVG